MRAEPQIPPIPIAEVIHRVRQRYFAMSRPSINPFGVHTTRSRIYWRDELSGELGLLAAVPKDDFPVTIAAVLDELAKLRAGAPVKRKSVSSAITNNKAKTARRRAS